MAFLRKHPIIRKIHDVLLINGFEKAYILDVIEKDQCIQICIQLPIHKEVIDLESVLTNMKEELRAMDVKVLRTTGKRVTLLFGLRDLSKVPFIPDYLHPHTLKVEFPSPYGSCILDFADGASCHLLNGGTTRMGKTSLLLYLATVLYVQTDGEIDLYITSTKLKDFYPFEGIASLSKTESELELVLDELILEYKKRDALLYSPTFKKATDAKSVKKLYPKQYYLFRPVFVIIDEYARFSDHKKIQKKVMELVETAGYVNIHVIISTQRPDAKTVLPPRIKGNLLARICFTTTDKNNSLIILDKEGAERLGKIQGRAIFLDSEMNLIQVPYLETEKADELLTPFRKEVILNETINSKETNNNQETKGSNDNTLADKISSMFEESVMPNGVSSKLKPRERLQQNHEKDGKGWFLLADQTDKR